MTHTHEEFKPVAVLYCIPELFDICFIKNQLANAIFIHIFWEKKEVPISDGLMINNLFHKTSRNII